MGNAFGDGAKTTVQGAVALPKDTGSFNAKEKQLIKDLYARVVAADAPLPTPPQPVLPPQPAPVPTTMLPRLQHLLAQRGVLKDEVFFRQFLNDAMRVNSNTTLEVVWDLWDTDADSDTDANANTNAAAGYKTWTPAQRLQAFFELLIEVATEGSPPGEAERAALAGRLADCTMRGRAPAATAGDALMAVKSWTTLHGPRVAKVFESYLTETCFPHERNPSFFPFRPPTFVGPQQTSEVLPGGALDLLPLALYHESLQGEWARLYSSSTDGISFNRMVHHVMGYDGPMCFLIKPQGRTNCVFGAFTSGRWRDFNRFFGASDTFLFTLRPDVKILRSRDRSNGNYQWLNQKSFGMPHGLGLGGTHDGFRLFVPESFEQCRAAESCMTFETGKLLPDVVGQEESLDSARYTFEIDHIEVWACGGADNIQRGVQAQVKDRELRDENIQKARKVDKAAFFNNSFDREFLLGNTFAHKAQVDDRADDDAR